MNQRPTAATIRLPRHPAMGRVGSWCAAALLITSTVSGCTPAFLRSASPALENPPAPVPRTVDEVQAQVQLDAAEPYWPYRLAQMALDRHDHDAARAALASSLERDAHYWPAHALLSKLDFDAGRHGESIERLESARRRAQAAAIGFPQDLDAALALHYDALDDLARAEDALQRVSGGGGQPTASAGVYLRLRGESPQGIERLAEDAIRHAPESAVNQNNFGITRLRAGDPQTARRAFQRAIQLDPELPGPYYNLAILEKFYAFDDAAAAAWFAKYWQRSTDDPDGLLEIFATDGAKTANKE